MIVAMLHENHAGVCTGKLFDSLTNSFLFETWQANSRGQLIAEMRPRLPLSHLVFQDYFDGKDP